MLFHLVELALQKKSHLRESESLEAKLLEHQKRYEAQKKKELKIEVCVFKIFSSENTICVENLIMKCFTLNEFSSSPDGQV